MVEHIDHEAWRLKALKVYKFGCRLREDWESDAIGVAVTAGRA